MQNRVASEVQLGETLTSNRERVIKATIVNASRGEIYVSGSAARIALFRTFVLSTAVLGAFACRPAAPPPDVADPGPATTDNSAVIPEVKPADTPPRPSGKGHPDWLGVSSSDSALPREGPVAFEAYGHKVSALEYQSGYLEYLNGRQPSDEAEHAFRDRLSEELLLLAWLEDSPLRRDPVFRAQLRARLRGQLAEDALESLIRKDLVPVSDDDVQRLYQQRLDRYRTPAQVRIRLIQTSTEDERRSAEALLEEGGDFESIAREISRHASAARGGELDAFPRGTLGNRELEDLAFRLEPGEVGAVSVPAGHFIVKKIGSIPESVRSFDSVSADLRNELEAERRAEARIRVMTQLETERTWEE